MSGVHGWGNQDAQSWGGGCRTGHAEGEVASSLCPVPRPHWTVSQAMHMATSMPPPPLCPWPAPRRPPVAWSLVGSCLLVAPGDFYPAAKCCPPRGLRQAGPTPCLAAACPQTPELPPAATGPPGPCPHPTPPWSVLPAGAGFLLPRGSSSASLIRRWLLGIGSHICSPVWPRYPARRLEHGAGSHSECGSRGFRRPWPGTHDSLARHCLLQTES